MTLRATQAILELRPPGAAGWTTVATDRTAGLVAIDDVTITWGKPTPRDHPTPGNITLTVLADTPNMPAIAYDTELKLSARLERYFDGAGWQLVDFITPNQLLARGWIAEWARGKRRRDGRYPFHITAIDILGRAAATNLGAAPWPTHTSAARLTAINTASKAGPLLSTTDTTWLAGRARDVDNANALDVIRQEARIGTYAGEWTDGISGRPQARRYPVYTNQELQFTSGAISIIDAPARLIVDTGRALDRRSTLSEVAVTCYRGTAATEKTTTTYRPGPGSYSSSRYSIDTDHTYTSETSITNWATALVAESQTPAVRIPETRLLCNLPVYTGPNAWHYLIRLISRGDVFLRITDCPPDIDPLHHVTAGRLTINGLRLDLTVTLTPARLYGVRPMRFTDLPTDATRPRIRGTNWPGTPVGYTYKTRIQDTSAITFAVWPS